MTRIPVVGSVVRRRVYRRPPIFAAPVADASHIVGAPAPRAGSYDPAVQDEAGAANHVKDWWYPRCWSCGRYLPYSNATGRCAGHQS